MRRTAPLAFLHHPWAGLVLRLVVGIVFAYASLDKIRHPDLFARDVLDYRFLPMLVVVPFAVLLPWSELAAGVFLMLGFLRRGSAAVILAMLLAFVVAIGTALARGIDIACGCFSVTAEGERLAWMTLGRDLVLIAAVLAVLTAPRTALELSRARGKPRARA